MSDAKRQEFAAAAIRRPHAPEKHTSSVFNKPQMRYRGACRAMALAGCAVLAMCQSELDSHIARLWDVCKASALFRHDSWEPGVVGVTWTFAFFFWCATAAQPSTTM